MLYLIENDFILNLYKSHYSHLSLKFLNNISISEIKLCIPSRQVSSFNSEVFNSTTIYLHHCRYLNP